MVAFTDPTNSLKHRQESAAEDLFWVAVVIGLVLIFGHGHESM